MGLVKTGGNLLIREVSILAFLPQALRMTWESVLNFT